MNKVKLKRWIKLYFTILFLFGMLPFSFSYIFLSRAYENTNFSEIVKLQLQNDAIYGTALNQNNFDYKLELIKATKPAIIALGSSRVMQFKEDAFYDSFINAGGAMNHLSEGVLFVEALLKFHKPKYIILGLDFWWFNDNFAEPSIYPYHGNYGDIMDIQKIFMPYSYIMHGNINPSMTINIFANNLKNDITNYNNMGLNAIKTSDGFKKDGSYLYSKTLFGIAKPIDEQFIDTLKRISEGNRRFEYAQNISQKRMEIFKSLMQIIIKENIKLIVFIPPVSNQVYKNMDKNKYAYIDDLIKQVKQITNVYNYHHVDVFGGDDCEYIDGFHGGDIVYQRILKDIFDSKKYIDFNKLIKIKNINKNISKYKGFALSIEEYNNNFMHNEIDFLKLGCAKNK